MKANELRMTTAGDVLRVLMSDGSSAAIDELTGLSSPITAAYAIAVVMHGLKNPYAAELVKELATRVDLADALDRRAEQGR